MAETAYQLIPLEQWRQAQSSEPNAALDDMLQEGQCYALDGGVFRAKQSEDGRWELWTHLGQNGNDVGTRNGFEVDAEGRLYDRFYDVVEEQALVLTQARFTVADVHLVTPELEISILMETARTTALGRHEAKV